MKVPFSKFGVVSRVHLYHLDCIYYQKYNTRLCCHVVSRRFSKLSYQILKYINLHKTSYLFFEIHNIIM